MSCRALLWLAVAAMMGCSPSADTGRQNLARALGPSGGMVISQVYGGGGNSGAVLTYDYVELFNRGPVAVNLTNWSFQYAAATSSNWQVLPLLDSVPPGHYYLIQLGSQNSSVGAPLPATYDTTSNLNLSASGGKVALVGSTAACGSAASPCSSSAAVVDFVGYGAASESEGSAAPAPGTNGVLIRKKGGCTETNDNAGDFALQTWVTVSSIALHDSSSPAAPCAVPADAGRDTPSGDRPLHDHQPPLDQSSPRTEGGQTADSQTADGVAEEAGVTDGGHVGGDRKYIGGCNCQVGEDRSGLWPSLLAAILAVGARRRRDSFLDMMSTPPRR